MSLNSALVDRARRLVDTPTPVRVEGTTQFQTLTYPWFKVRLTLSPAPESDDTQGARRRVPRPASLLVGLKDADGNPVAINADDRLEVDSKQLGRAIYQVTGDWRADPQEEEADWLDSDAHARRGAPVHESRAVSFGDVRYVGPYLPDVFAQEPLDRALRRTAEKGGDRLHEYIVAFTPIKTGNLATSWYRKPTRRELHGTTAAYVAPVATDVSYAPYVNYGTGLWGPEHRKYLIEPHPPNRFLSWIDPLTGKRVFARRVWHPGSEGHHMIENAGSVVHAGLNEMMLPELETYKREAEAAALASMRGVVIP